MRYGPASSEEDLQPSLTQQRRDHTTHRAHADQDHVGGRAGRFHAALRIVAGISRGDAAVQREAQVGHGLNDAAFGHRFGAEVFFGAVFHPDARVAEDAPAQLVFVAAVQRIGEESFLHVGAGQGEEILLARRVEVGQITVFHATQQRVLLIGRGVGEDTADFVHGGAVQRRQPQPVRFALIPVRPGQRPIHIVHHTDFHRAGDLVGGEDALEQRRGGARFVKGEVEVGHGVLLWGGMVEMMRIMRMMELTGATAFTIFPSSHHLPLNSAFRRSRNAANPSCKSSV
ncbi:MAG: hypothetical protein R2873_28185 [Caldilineaceae bacterium]